MPFQVLEQTTPYGKLADNFGKSLGETVGDETQRQVTSRGVGRLADQLAKSGVTDRLQLMTSLSQVPGMTPEAFNQYLPAFESSLRARAAAQLGKNDQGGGPTPSPIPAPAPDGGATPAPAPDDGAAPVASTEAFESDTSLLTEDDRKVLTERDITLTQEDLLQRASARMQQNPALYPTLEAALEAEQRDIQGYNQDLAQRRDAAQRKEAITNQITQDLETALNNKLQTLGKQETWGQIPGTILDNLTRRAIADVRDGKTVSEAVKKASDAGLRFGRETLDFKAITPKSMTDSRFSNYLDTMRNYRETYAEFDALPEFTSELQRKGMGKHMSSALAYPPSTSLMEGINGAEFKDLGKLAYSQAKDEVGTWEKLSNYWLSSFGGLVPGNVSGVTTPKKSAVRKKQEKLGGDLVNKMTGSMTTNDSVNTMALMWADAGLDSKAFYKKMNEAATAGKWQPTERQKQELKAQVPVEPTLWDLARNVFSRSGQYGFTETLVKYIQFGGES